MPPGIQMKSKKETMLNDPDLIKLDQPENAPPPITTGLGRLGPRLRYGN
jgi:hypothetical protein